jgi:hypothetical protein
LTRENIISLSLKYHFILFYFIFSFRLAFQVYRFFSAPGAIRGLNNHRFKSSSALSLIVKPVRLISVVHQCDCMIWVQPWHPLSLIGPKDRLILHTGLVTYFLYCRKMTETQLLRSNIRNDSYHDTIYYSLVQGKCSISNSFEGSSWFWGPSWGQ